MVCFHLVIGYEEDKRDVINVMNKKRLEHICRSYNADMSNLVLEGTRYSVSVAACDQDAVGILRDIPAGMYCISINILRTDILVYSHYKVTQTKVVPPRNFLLKQVYWTASQLEPRFSRASKV